MPHLITMLQRSCRLPLAALLAAGMLAGAGAPAFAATSKPAAQKPAAAKPAQRKSGKATGGKPGSAAKAKQAAPVAVAEPEVALTAAQVAAAERVLVGQMACEFGKTVQLAAVPQRPGYFHLTLGKQRFVLVPYETTTGAVRLEDRNDGIVWLQIPAKSMLLNAKLGQRLVDNCMHDSQRSFIASADSALGIEQPVAPPMVVLVQDGSGPVPTAATAATAAAGVAATAAASSIASASTVAQPGAVLAASGQPDACEDPRFEGALAATLVSSPDTAEPMPLADCSGACACQSPPLAVVPAASAPS